MAEGLWPFALRFYDDAATQAACLAVQDRAEADVNVLLWLLWRASRGEVIDAAGLQALDARVAPWREEVVRPLRAVRRRMKEAALGPAPDVQESLRNQVKKVELAAEKAQHGVLEAAAITAAATAPPAEAAARNLDALAANLGTDLPGDAGRVLLNRFRAIL